jgi:glycosyltransferase involved in cell wall biosynthesis
VVRVCVIIPHFDHVEQFAGMLEDLVSKGLPLVVVDDASPEQAFRRLEELLDRAAPGTLLLRHTENQGKGGAVMSGLKAAYAAGYSHALQIDADGQHRSADIPRFISLASRYPEAVICGKPVFDDSISKLRYYARHITLFFSWLETLSTVIEDPMCGFRLYPLSQVLPVVERGKPGKRMAFDPEILVRCLWAGIEISYIPVDVRYPEGGRSHFHYIRDNLEISWMHTVLIFGMLVRLPRLLARGRSGQKGRMIE